MGFLMLAGLVGSVLYSSYCVKNDLQAITTDNKIKPTFNQQDNKEKIRKNFVSICKRCKVKLDANNNPYKESDYKICVEYLKYQGYDDTSINYFITTFKEKANNRRTNKLYQINLKHSQLKQKYDNNIRNNDIFVTFKKHHYNHEEPITRMNTIMENDLWRTIVHHHTYVNDGMGQYCEVWSLKVPNNFFSNYKIEDLYKEVCWIQNISDGSFIK